MSIPSFSKFVKQYGQLWCNGRNFSIYLAPNMANNDSTDTLYVEHDTNVITLEEVKAVVITDHILMYNNSTIDRAEGITLDDIIDGLNKLNFITLK